MDGTEVAPPLNLTTTIKVDDSKREAVDVSPSSFTVEGVVIDENREQCVGEHTPIETDGGEYSCLVCSKVFPRASQLRPHMRTHEDAEVYECDECNEVFSRLSSLITHRKKHFECKECAIVFQTQSQYKTHQRLHHKAEKKFQCSKCSMKFVQQNHLTTHIRIHTGEKPYSCDICNQKFKQVSHLTTHYRIHTKDRPYVCQVCEASFTQSSSLKRHTRSHTGEKPYQCEICNRVFVEKRNLTRHLMTHSGIKPYKCDKCKSSFSQMVDLKRHIMSHEGLRPYKCDKCTAAFSRKNNLKWHKLTHEGETPHKCDVCDAKFNVAKELKHHYKTHFSNKQVCPVCKMVFNDIKEFKKHKESHNFESDKYLECELCDAKFSNKQRLSKHLQRHKGVKPYSCDLCVFTFSEQHLLKRHKVCVHNVDRYNIDDNVDSSKESSDIKKAPAEPLNQQPLKKRQIGTIIEKDSKKIIDFPSPLPPTNLNPNPNDEPPPVTPSSASTISNPSVNDLVSIVAQGSEQMPSLVLTQPGQQPRAARLAGNCQNHESHILTFLEGNFGQWQTWCFCDPPNIPDNQEFSNHTTPPVSYTLPSSQNQNSMSYSTPNSQIPAQAQVSYATPTSHGSVENSRTNINNTPVYYTTVYNDQTFVQNPDIASVEANFKPPKIIQQPIDNKEERFNRTYNISEVLNPVVDINPSEILPHGQNPIKSTQRIYITQDRVNIPDTFEPPLISNQKIESEPQIDKIITPANLYLKDETLSLDSNKDSDLINLHKYDSEKTRTISVKQNFFQQPPVEDGQNASINKSNNVSINSDPKSEIDKPPTTKPTDDLTMQYSFTVNNPATGDIRIESEAFAAKTPENSTPKKKTTPQTSTSSKVYTCDGCPKVFSRQNHLSTHLRVHTGEKPFGCSICGQTYAHNNSLVIHMRCHTGERPYECNMCDAKFTQRSNLRVHLRVHTGERPFKCDLCDAAFSQGSHLTAHKRIHFNERPYECETCGQRFTQRSALKRHCLTHTGDNNNFICKICSLKFVSEEKYKQHYKAHEDGGQWVCTEAECESKFNNEADLISHNQFKHPRKITKVKKAIKRDTKKKQDSHKQKVTKSKRNATFEPTRTSKRIKEASLRNKDKKEDSDFIVGEFLDMEQFDEHERGNIEMRKEDNESSKNNTDDCDSDPIITVNNLQNIYVSENQNKEIKQVEGKGSKSDDHWWCFCEVPHRPDEPHTSHVDSATLKAANICQQKYYEIGKSVPNQVIISEPLQYFPTSERLTSETYVLEQPQSISTITSNDHGKIKNPEKFIIQQSNLPPTITIQENIPSSAPVVKARHILKPNEIQYPSSGTNSTRYISTTSLPHIPTRTTNQLTSTNASPLQPDTPHLQPDTSITHIETNTSQQGFESTSNTSQIGTDVTELTSRSDLGQIVPITNSTQLLSAANPTQLVSMNLGSNIVNQDGAIYLDTGEMLQPGTVLLNPSQGTFIYELAPDNQQMMAVSIDNSVLLQNIPTSSNQVLPSSTSESPAVVNQTEYNHIEEMMDVEYKMPLEKEGDFKCFGCSKSYANKAEMVDHAIESHSNLFTCAICFETYNTQEELKEHEIEKKHLIEKEKSCSYCNLSFNSMSSLLRHSMLEHKAKKAFRCSSCDSRFYQKSDLKRHMLCHTGEKPYLCHVCHSGFTRMSSLNKHMRIHTGEKPYQCEVCKVSFIYRYQFNRHTKAAKCVRPVDGQ